jgi:hypothetical protein
MSSDSASGRRVSRQRDGNPRLTCKRQRKTDLRAAKCGGDGSRRAFGERRSGCGSIGPAAPPEETISTPPPRIVVSLATPPVEAVSMPPLLMIVALARLPAATSLLPPPRRRCRMGCIDPQSSDRSASLLIQSADGVTPSWDAAARKLSLSATATNAVRSVRLPRCIPELPSVLHAIKCTISISSMSTALLPPIQPREEVAWQTMEEGISFLNTAASSRRQPKPHNGSRRCKEPMSTAITESTVAMAAASPNECSAADALVSERRSFDAEGANLRREQDARTGSCCLFPPAL